MHASSVVMYACRALANVWLSPSCLLQRGAAVPTLCFPRACASAQYCTRSVFPSIQSWGAFPELAVPAGSAKTGSPRCEHSCTELPRVQPRAVQPCFPGTVPEVPAGLKTTSSAGLAHSLTRSSGAINTGTSNTCYSTSQSSPNRWNFCYSNKSQI